MVTLEGKAVVITGAGRGIGAATARLAAQLGARVVVNDLDRAEAEATVEGIRGSGGEAVAHPADISDWNAAAGMVDACIDNFGRIDGLFNNAGYFGLAKLEEITPQQLRKALEVNVVGTFACAVRAIAAMRGQGGGAILNVTSGAQMGIPAMSVYGASKGAVASATYAWSEELKGSGIRVNALSPMAATRMMAETARYLGRDMGVGLPPEVNAPVACYLLSDAAAEVTGQVVRIEGRNLSLTTHPGILLPMLVDDWDVDRIAEAFRSDLAAKQFPSGTVGMSVQIGGNASRSWD